MQTRLLIILTLGLVVHVSAKGATWNLIPTNNDWTTADNWTPQDVPDQPGERADFGPSSITAINLRNSITINSVVFAADARPYTIYLQPATFLIVDVAGLINNSGLSQGFFTKSAPSGLGAIVDIENDASSGTQMTFTNQGNTDDVFAYGGHTELRERASAGENMYVNQGGTAEGAYGGLTAFFEHASAGNATFINEAGTVAGALGGYTFFIETALGATGTFTSRGATVEAAVGGATVFDENSSAMNDVLVAEAGSNGGGGGRIIFSQNGNGGSATVILHGNGILDMSPGFLKLVTIGSLEGDGIVMLRGSVPFKLVIGGNNLSTTFSGTIQSIGSLSKEGTGTLTLTGASTYSGGTTAVEDGALIVNNLTGSATGTGAVSVNAGTLGGSGIIAGPVTVGTNGGTGAFLAPSKGVKKPAALTIQSALTLNDDSTYLYKLDTKRAVSDQVIATGVVIDSGAKFSLRPSGTNALTLGQVFTVIDNTATTPIAGAFHNLRDGQIITVNGNHLQASYTGGDGNDFTLTVVP